jgi:NADH-ubiquinone oxidoreductase chain 2
MLLIGLISLLIAIPLYSSTITPTLLTRITSIILLFSAAISFNRLYVQAIGSGLGLYSGLFHVTTVTQAMEMFLYVVGALILLPWASPKKDDLQSGNRSGQEVSTSNFGFTSAVPSIPEYPLIILFTTIGASFLISSADLVSMYLSIELQSFAVYILAAIYRNSESATSAGLKYFLLGALSSALILLGSSLIYAYTGLTNFESIYMLSNVVGNEGSLSTHGMVSQAPTAGIVLGVLIIGVGFLFKVAAAPFHNWAPDVYDGVPTIVTTWLTVMPKISIFIFLLEFTGGAIGSETVIDMGTSNALFLGENTSGAIFKNLLLTTSLLSLVIGTVVGLAQYRLKRLLAFSTISHVGFLLLALSVNSEESITSFLFYIIQYSITNLDAFFVVLALGYVINNQISYENNGNNSTDITYISQLKGQFYANPILGLSLALCLFSMAGIPPLVGFFAKYRVLYSAIENGYYFLAFVGIIASVISAAYYLRIIRVIHFDQKTNDLSLESGQKSEATFVLTSRHSYIISVLTLLVVLFILSPSLVLNSSNLLALSLFTA